VRVFDIAPHKSKASQEESTAKARWRNADQGLEVDIRRAGLTIGLTRLLRRAPDFWGVLTNYFFKLLFPKFNLPWVLDYK